MNEEKLESLLKDDSFDDELMQKRLNKKINRRIYKKSILSVLVFCIVIVSAYLSVFFLMDLSNYDPRKEPNFLPDGELGYSEDKGYNNFKALLTLYVPMILPGVGFDAFEARSLGFGRYEIKGKSFSYGNYYSWGGDENAVFSIRQSSLDLEQNENNKLFKYVGEFDDSHDPYGIYEHRELEQTATQLKEIVKEYYQDIKDLPNSAMIDVSISFKDYLTLEDVVDLMNQYDNLYNGSTSHTYFTWLAMKGMEESMTPQMSGGFPLIHLGSNYGFNQEAEKKYPYLYLDRWDFDTLTADILKQSFVSRIQLFLDHPKFVNIMSSYFTTYEDLEKRYEILTTEEPLAYGIRGMIMKDDLLSIMDQYDIYILLIHDVKISPYSR